MAKEAIIVGVDCIPEIREKELDYLMRGDLYAKFLIETLKPWVDQNFYKIVDTAPFPAHPVSLYVDYGDYGGDGNYPVPGREFLNHLRGLGLKEPRLRPLEFPYADHFEADWARRVDIPLQWILND